MLLADAATLVLANGDPATGSRQDDVEVHAVNTDRRVVLNTEIDVLLDTETEVARVGEVLRLNLVVLNAKAEIDELLSLLTANSDVRRDLLITTNGERSDSVTSCERIRGRLQNTYNRSHWLTLGEDGLLVSELLQHRRSTRQTVTTADRDVQDKLLNPNVHHRIGRLVLDGLLACHDAGAIRNRFSHLRRRTFLGLRGLRQVKILGRTPYSTCAVEYHGTCLMFPAESSIATHASRGRRYIIV